MYSINIYAVLIPDALGVCLCIMLLGSMFWKNSSNKGESKMIIMMIGVCIMSCVMDFFSSFFDSKAGFFQGEAYVPICFIANEWLFLANVLISSLWLTALLIHITGKRINKIQQCVVIGLDAISLCAIFGQFFAPIIFEIASHNGSAPNYYRRGPLYLMFVIIEAIFIVDGVVVYIVERIRKKKECRYFPVVQFILPVVAGIIIQTEIRGISTIWPSISISLCGLILGIYNEGEEERKLLKQHEDDAQLIIQQREEINRSLEAAENASRAKTEFLFNMSHDIRTPMNAILGYADIGIRHSEDPEKVKEYIEKIKTSGSHLLDLINNILEMSRIESGKLEIASNPMDIRESNKSVIQLSESLALTKSIDFIYEIEEIDNPYILSDELHLNEILINLITNAVKYNNFGGKVWYSVRQISPVDNGVVRFRFIVADNGIGMSEEFKKHIWENFSRERTSTVSKQEGTGLGLSIVKKIVDLAGGSIVVESKKGKGSKFIVELPFKVMSKAQEKEFIAEKEQTTVKDDDFTLKGKRVLLVEDNFMNREIANEILTEAGLLVETAEDGSIAVSKFKANKPDYYDYILMDIQMPVMNGYEATKAIRELPEGKDITIIALSANAFKEDIQKSLEHGMNDHVAKPINVKDLFEVMKNFAK